MTDDDKRTSGQVTIADTTLLSNLKAALRIYQSLQFSKSASGGLQPSWYPPMKIPLLLVDDIPSFNDKRYTTITDDDERTSGKRGERNPDDVHRASAAQAEVLHANKRTPGLSERFFRDPLKRG